MKYQTLFHLGWDLHLAIKQNFPLRCGEIDQPAAALVMDLKQRGLLDDTLVMFGSEFGRTPFAQGQIDNPLVGRDHHGGCFTWWFAGGGVKAGYTHGETDEFSYNVVKDPVHIHDLNATLLHIVGLDHERADVPLPGPRLPFDRRPWQGRAGDLGVTRAYAMQDFVFFLGRFHVLALHLPIGIVIAAVVLDWLARRPRYAALAQAVAVPLGRRRDLGRPHGRARLPALRGRRLHGAVGRSAPALGHGDGRRRAWSVGGSRARGRGTIGVHGSRPGIAMLALVSITGHYGGNLTHGTTFLQEYAPSFLRR